MLIWVAGVALAWGTAQEADAAKTVDAAKELAKVAAAMAKVESYSFASKTETEGDGFGGGRGGPGAGAEGGEAPATKGAYKQGLPMRLQSGDTEIYKDGEQVVYKGEDGKWTTFDRSAFSRGGSPGRGGDRDAGGAGRGERGGEGRGERGGEGRGERGGEGRADRGGDRGGFAGMRAMFSMMSTTAPHQLFDGLSEKISDVSRTEKDGVITYSANLTEKGIESTSPAGGRMGRGGSGPEMKTVGTIEIRVKNGAIAAYKVRTSRSGSFGERSFEMTTTQVVEFDKLGGVELEVPADVLSHFEI